MKGKHEMRIKVSRVCAGQYTVTVDGQAAVWSIDRISNGESMIWQITNNEWIVWSGAEDTKREAVASIVRMARLPYNGLSLRR